jgi:hypothetical protein
VSDELEKQNVPATEDGEDEDVEAHKHLTPKHEIAESEDDDDVEAHKHLPPKHNIV